MDREGGRFMSWLPLNWKTKALSNEGKTANDKDASGSDFREKLMQAASRLGGLMTEPSATEVNGFQPSDLNVALLPGHLEYTSADPQTDPKRREEHLHGSRWQDPFCSLFRVWQDPICTLFQTKNLAPCTQVENVDAGGSYTSGTPLYKSNATSRRFDLKYGVGTDCAVKQKDLNVASKSSQEVTWHLPPIQGYCQENLFRDMGFPPALIQRAILLHGVQADDSIILQFLLDWRENNNVLGSNIKKLADYSETTLTNDEINATEESVSGLLTVREQIENSEKKKGAEQLWGNDGSDPSDTDFDDDDEGAPPRNARSAIDWTAERGSDHLVSLCKRELPTREDHRHLMSSHGFAAQLVERAIQDLGEGVDYETLLEYLLYLTSQQDPTASTSQASCVKRGGPAKKVLKECKKQQKNYKGRLNIVEKLVEECGYPAKAVERAVIVCGTPLWNAEENQIADLVDFLAAHCAGLNESEDTAISEEDLQDDAHWSWLRQHLEEDVSTSGGAKGNLGCGTVTRRKTIVRLSRPSDLEREQQNKPPLSRAYNPERELSLNSKQSASPRHRMKLERSQRRYTPVGRIGRLRMVNMEVSTTVDRHNGSVGFGLPGNPVQPRYLDEDVEGAPFFYFENVASMPNDEWDRIRRHLFDIEPEFVDSLHFSACRRPRGYIHNLPTDGRRKILADPPMTIQELLPHTKPFWPAWDPRTKLNCITTRMGSEFLIKKLNIREGTALQTSDPSPEQQREILHLCRHWNLVWTSPNIPTPVDDSEIEAMLGFDAGHSRNILSNRSRYKALGNSFSVYTVAFHFSVLKPLYPKGVKVLSLFSGIGGAEVALHKMGIKLLVVVSVEIDDGTRRCLQAWWASSKQTGVLNQNYHNIKDLGRSQISELVNMYGGFDLIVGGTPCNNLSGSNHVTRVGLDGKQSTIFFEFSRVVTAVRELTIRLQRKK